VEEYRSAADFFRKILSKHLRELTLLVLEAKTSAHQDQAEVIALRDSASRQVGLVSGSGVLMETRGFARVQASLVAQLILISCANVRIVIGLGWNVVTVMVRVAALSVRRTAAGDRT